MKAWQSGGDLRIVPTSATVGWEQVNPDTWRFVLWLGVRFQIGEPWHADAAFYRFSYQGDPT